jgi:hypothetical protein
MTETEMIVKEKFYGHIILFLLLPQLNFFEVVVIEFEVFP